MKIRNLVLGAVALLSVSTLAAGNVAYAQDGGGAPGQGGGQGRGQGRGQGGGQRMGGGRAVIEAFNAVTPTADQKTKFEALQTKMRADMQAARPADGGQPGPEFREKMTAINTKFTADVKALLTPEQAKKFDEEMAKSRGNQGGMNLMTMLDNELKLTPEQKTKIEPIAKTTQEDLMKLFQDQTTEPAARREKATSLMNDFKGKVRPLLTPEQQGKLDAMRMPMGGGRGGNRGGAGQGRGGNRGGGNPGQDGGI
jgi:Spy/CpxP family protein refolding chaperone